MEQTFVEASDSHYKLTPRNNGRGGSRQVIEVIDHMFKDISALRWRKDTRVRQRFPLIVYLEACAMDEADIWASSEQRHLSFELFRKPDVIAVEEGNEFGSRCSKTDISCVGGAPMFAAENAKFGPSTSIFGKNRRRRVRRPIINCNHSVRLETLYLYAIETDFDQARAIIDWNNNVYRIIEFTMLSHRHFGSQRRLAAQTKRARSINESDTAQLSP